MSSRKHWARRFLLQGSDASEGQSALARFFRGRRFALTSLATFFIFFQVLILALGAGETLTFLRLVGLTLLVTLVHALAALFLSIWQPEVLENFRKLAMLELLSSVLLLTGKILLLLEAPKVLIPLPLFGMAFAVAFSRRFALLYTIFMSLLLALMTGIVKATRLPEASLQLNDFVILGIGSLIGIFLTSRFSSRSQIIRAGLLTGLGLMVAAAANTVLFTPLALDGLELQDVDQWKTLGRTLLLCLLHGLFTGYLLVEFGISFIERAFDVITDLRLTALMDLNQPIFRRYNISAPGTFHHSQVVAQLAEAAAKAIGANAKLTKVGAYFHDIGKMVKPEYFVENMKGQENKHESLTPTMSTLIIIAHVKDGVEIASELGLPNQVIDFIREHHGTQAVEYFYRMAKKNRKPDEGQVTRDSFRYPGPNPRSKETAILMMADTVEAISRTLQDPAPSRVQSMVRQVIMDKLQGGYLDDCPLTLKELKTIERAMTRTLLVAFHGRIEYPDEEEPPERVSEVASESSAASAAGEKEAQGAPTMAVD